MWRRKQPDPPQEVPASVLSPAAPPTTDPLLEPTAQHGVKQLPQIRTLNDRLSLPLAPRILLATTMASASGLVLGLAKGSQDSGFRFRAENAHRLPKTQTGWFLYHKSKNYNMMLGGVVEGMKQSVRFGLWTGLYFVLEEGVDRGRAAGGRMWRRFWDREWAKGGKEMRMASLGDDELSESEEEHQVVGNRDCVSSMFAGLGTAGVFSAWNRFPLPTAARTAKMGAKAGLAFGLLQDLVSVIRGRRVGYVEFVMRHTVGLTGDVEDAQVS